MFSSPPGNPTDRSGELVERYRDMFTPVARAAEEKVASYPDDSEPLAGGVWPDQERDMFPNKDEGAGCLG